MADNYAFTPGSGGTGASDDVSGVQYPRVKISAGADGIAADSGTFTASSSFNRPVNTTAYSVGDNVSNNATAGSVTPLSWTISASAASIRRIRVRKSDQTVATPTIRVWLFESSPTVGSGDNAAFAQPLAACIGYVDVDVIFAGSDDAVGWTDCDIPVVAATMYGLLTTQSVFTPAGAETFTVTIWALNG